MFEKIFLETIKRIDSEKIYSPCKAGGRFVEIFPDGIVRGCEVEKLWDVSEIGSVNKTNLDIGIPSVRNFDHEVKKYCHMWREGGQFSTDKYLSET